ncbi:hypothetical protein T4C_1947 [Trichinella pseudospiralis]|uniref:Uncharacterized protein n=1 Tax=Trichinella pseudospiralis TaxID=6337 RepID=A0A0V1KE89_TRIPS|nr:hypothetical protein T4C_1947 [Trichinella pseudospiralis]
MRQNVISVELSQCILANSCAVVASGKLCQLKENYAMQHSISKAARNTYIELEAYMKSYYMIFVKKKLSSIYVDILTGNINNACQHSSIKIAPTAHMLTAAGQEIKKGTSNIINVMLACLIPSYASDCISVKLGNAFVLLYSCLDFVK